MLRQPTGQVSDALLRLQLEQKVRLKNGVDWQWIGPIPSRVPVGPVDSTSSQSVADHGTLGDGAPRAVIPGGRWADFRRLCLYYAECVRLEDRARVSEYVDKENRRFLSLSAGLDWRAASAGAPVATTIPPEGRDFSVYLKSQRRRSPRLFLGYPTEVAIFPDRYNGGTCRVVSPVLVIQVQPQIDGDKLFLLPQGPVEVNHGWLEKRFRNQDERQAFLEIVGLENPEPQEDDQPREALLPSLPDVAAALQRNYQSWCREVMAPDRPDIQPGLGQIAQKGIYNRALVIAQPGLKYAARLHEELLWLAQSVPDDQLDGTALRLLMPHEPPNKAADPCLPMAAADSPEVAEYETMNRSQRQACRAGMSQALSVVTGPPGTGKSRVVAQTMANGAIAGATVLFSSRNHQAIEAVVPRINELVEPESLVVRLSKPFGEGNAVTLVQTLVNILSTPRPGDIAEKIESRRGQLHSSLRRRGSAEQQRQGVFELFEALEQAEGSFEEALVGLPEWMAAKIPSIDRLPGGGAAERAAGSVARLIHTPNRLAARLLWWIRRMLLGPAAVSSAYGLSRQFCEAFGRAASQPVKVTDRQGLARLVQELEAYARAGRCHDAAVVVHRLRDRLGLLPSLESSQENYRGCCQSVVNATEQLLKALSLGLGGDLPGPVRQRFAEIRGELQGTGDNLDRVSRKLERALTQCFPELLTAMPLWATTNLSVGRNIPRAAGAFDLLIVDEASQCDIASVIPLLFRAKRAMVVGDPMQLPHISTLRRDVDRRLRERFGLTDIRFGRYTHPNNSFYELAASDAGLTAKTLLQDHHRSHHLIAGYCNATFYRGRLRVMTNTDGLRLPVREGKSQAGFLWSHVPADAEMAASSDRFP